MAHEDEAQRGQDDLRSAERQRADLQQQAERMSGQRRLLGERTEALNLRLSEATTHQHRLGADLDDIKQQLANQDDADLQANRQQSSTAVEQATTLYHDQSNRRDRLLAEFERLRHNNAQALQQRQKAEQGLNRLAQREVQLTTRLADLATQIEQQQNHVKAAAEQHTSAQQICAASEAALAVAQNELDGCRQARENCAQAFHQQESATRELHGIAQELRGRSQNEDVPDSLRDALRSMGGVWMDESLHVPEGLEAAAAAALRGRSADVYLADLCDFQSVLDQIETAPVALFGGLTTDTKETSASLASAIGIGVDHVLYPVFAPIQLVDNIMQAMTSTQCCVSRDGWRREPQGWLIPPSGNRTARRLAVQRSLRDSEANILTAEAGLKTSRQQFEAAESALEMQQKNWQMAHLAATQADSESQAADATVLRLQAEVAALQEHQQRLKHDLTELAEERQHWQTQAAQAADVERLAALQAQAEEHLTGQREVLQQADQALNTARQQQAQADQALALFAQARDHLLRQLERLGADDGRLNTQIESDQQRLQQAETEFKQAQDHNDLNQQLARAVVAVEAAHQTMQAVRSTGHALQQLQHEAERSERQARKILQLTNSKCQSIEVEQAQYATRLQDTGNEIEQRCQITAAQLLADIEGMDAIEDSAAVMQSANALEERINRFGPVNLLAINEFEQASQREGFLATQAADLEASLSTLDDTIARIDRSTKQRFKEVFDQTNIYFKQTFPQLFGGGRAELKLDSDDILTAGVEVIAQPPGKRLQDLNLLSGGEKALTAVALVFSIFKIKPAPFCVLDEVDAPLDDANVARFGAMVRELSDRVQFLSISHNKITMQQADRLIGVSMPEPGVSKIVSVDMAGVDH
ncbi:MAG: chromosome segregation protein SMC [Mariprofundus sp.]|nr:chromosome segregation protein SMC [Mariprofundus sp.]